MSGDQPGIDDPAEILRVLPGRYHEQFRSEYVSAVEQARDPEGFRGLTELLRLWRLRAAAVQYHDLPEPAQDALFARVVDLADAPWDNATVLPPGDDPAFRETVFGTGHGLLGFHVNEREETIRIFNNVWIA